MGVPVDNLPHDERTRLFLSQILQHWVQVST